MTTLGTKSIFASSVYLLRPWIIPVQMLDSGVMNSQTPPSKKMFVQVVPFVKYRERFGAIIR